MISDPSTRLINDFNKILKDKVTSDIIPKFKVKTPLLGIFMVSLNCINLTYFLGLLYHVQKCSFFSVCHWLFSVLSKYLGIIFHSHLAYSGDFIDQIKHKFITGNMVGFHLVSLCTNVPIDDVLAYLIIF